MLSLPVKISAGALINTGVRRVGSELKASSPKRIVLVEIVILERDEIKHQQQTIIYMVQNSALWLTYRMSEIIGR